MFHHRYPTQRALEQSLQIAKAETEMQNLFAIPIPRYNNALAFLYRSTTR